MRRDKIRSSKPLFAIATMTLIATFVLMACQAASSSAGPGGTEGAAVVPTSEVAGQTSVATEEAGTPGPTDLQLMDLNVLPKASFDAAAVKVTCDPAPSGSTAISCDDAVAAVAKIAATMSATPAKQMTIVRDTANPNLISITFVVKAEEGEGDTTFTTQLDTSTHMFTFPQEEAAPS